MVITKNIPVTALREDIESIFFEGMIFYLTFTDGTIGKYRFEFIKMERG